MAIIVIDPGHGGAATIPNDSTWNNAVGPNGTLEKTLTLDIGLRLVALLQAAGHTAKATRTTDVNLRLRDRAAVARQARADVFVSIHLNGSTGHNAQGTETLVETNHTARSAELSLAVQDGLLVATGLTDRNRTHNPATRIKPQNLGVLKLSAHHPETAACLAEISFLDRATEEARLVTVAYRDALAGALARGIAAFLAAHPLQRGRSLAFGDAIEVEAGTAKAAGVERFLGLGKPARTRGPVATNPEAVEKVTLPDDPFPRAFLRGGIGGFALARSAGQWADKADFVTFIAGLGLVHFSADEFLFLGNSNLAGNCKGLNSFPPRALWPNIARTAQMLDQIRTEMGASIRILSAYRSPAYNTCVGGEPLSRHSQFNATDFTCQAGTPEIWGRVAKRLRNANPPFEGGIGIYHSQNFVHIDTRGNREDWVKP